MKTHILDSLLCLAVLLSSCAPAPTTTETPTTAPSDVVILVVDDFAPPSGEREYNTVGNCVVTPDGQKFGSTGTGLERNLKDSHGNTVYEDLLEQVNKNSSFSKLDLDISASLANFANLNWMKQISVFNFDNGQAKLIIVGVDTERYTTTAVKENISVAISTFDSGSGIDISLSDGTSQHINRISRFVINMSFAVIPCKALEMTADEYIKEVSVFYSTDNVTKKLKSTEDPLYTLMTEKAPSNVVFVGAAGNLGQQFDFPLAPAIWDFVISVSAEDADTESLTNSTPCSRNGITDYSNCGEIKMNGDTKGNKGTSYAAPKFSYNVALLLMENSFSQCPARSTA